MGGILLEGPFPLSIRGQRCGRTRSRAGTGKVRERLTAMNLNGTGQRDWRCWRCWHGGFLAMVCDHGAVDARTTGNRGDRIARRGLRRCDGGGQPGGP